MAPESDTDGFPSKVYTIMACERPLLVLSGETDEEMLTAVDQKPDYVLPSVKELHELLKN